MMSGENQKTILLVEDDAITVEVEKVALEKFGYTIITATTGEEAVEIAKTNPSIDLILIDIDLGNGIDGTEATEMILRDHDIPVVFLSCHTESKIVEKIEKITSYGYVVKNSGITVLDASIKMAFKLFEANTKLNVQLERNTSIIQALPDLMFVLDHKGLYKEIYASNDRLLSLHSAEIVGKTLYDVFGKDEAERHLDVYRICMESGDLQILEYELEFQGQKKSFEARISKLNKDSILSIVRDITDRKRSDELLRVSERRLHMIVEHINDSFYIHDFNGNISDLNDNACKLLSYTREELLAGGLRLIDTPMNAEFVPERMSRLIRDGSIVFEGQHKGKDGNVVDVNISARIVSRDGNGIVQSFVRDITERKRAEEEREVLYTLGEAVNTTANLNEFLNTIHSTIKKVMYAENCYIALYDTSTETFSFPLFVDQFDLTPAPRAKRRGMTEYVLRIAKPFILTPELLDEMVRDREVEIIGSPPESWLGVPLIIQSKPIGVLVIQSYEPGKKYTDRDKDMLVMIGNQVATAIERKQAEDTLKKSEERMRAIIEGTPHLFFYTQDAEANNTYISPTVEHITGHKADIWLKRKDWFITDAAMNHVAKERTRANLRGEFSTEPILLEIHHASGHLILLEVYEYPITMNGKIVGLQGIAYDITERKRAEEALKESEFCLTRAEKVAKFGNWKLILNNKHLIGSIGARTIYGVDKEIMVLEDVQKAPLLEYRNMLDKALADLITKDIPYNVEFKIRRSNDGEIIDIHSIAEFDKKNNIIYGVIQDITEYNRSEEEKAKLEAQLTQAQKMESVGRLAGGVAHDFNNMLGVILGHTELALTNVDMAQSIKAHIEEIRKAAERSADLTRQLLAYARKQTVAPMVIDLNKTVEGMLKLLNRLIGEGIHLNWHPSENLWPVRMDLSQIDQILANLCVNARDAIKDIGQITIETGNNDFDASYCADHAGFVPGEYVRLSVCDNGCGMDKETLGHIFEPFFTTKGVGKGTGLGLATVYGIVKQNNGFVYAYSEPGQGTVFTIYLPRQMDKAVQIPVEFASVPASRGHETILLVEDDPGILNLTTTMLEMQGYTILPASSPGQAIRLARDHDSEIDLLLTDVIMPEMNGRDLAKNLLSSYPHIKRLFMSGYTANIIAHHGVLDEGVFFIQKPFSIKDLAAKVRDALDRGQ